MPGTPSVHLTYDIKIASLAAITKCQWRRHISCDYILVNNSAPIVSSFRHWRQLEILSAVRTFSQCYEGVFLFFGVRQQLYILIRSSADCAIIPSIKLKKSNDKSKKNNVWYPTAQWGPSHCANIILYPNIYLQIIYCFPLDTQFMHRLTLGSAHINILWVIKNFSNIPLHTNIFTFELCFQRFLLYIICTYVWSYKFLFAG